MAEPDSKPQLILSIQSHVAYGHVGNSAAAFPLQTMGCELITVHTVQFSSHKGYASSRGDIFSKDHIEQVLSGLKEQGVYPSVRAVITGYMGDPELGELVYKTVRSISEQNENLIYLCDPVMGDTRTGLFVHKDLPEFFKQKALPLAGIITPNMYELSVLSDSDIQSQSDIIKACRGLHKKGPDTILVTSVITGETPEKNIEMLVSQKDGKIDTVQHPRLEMTPPPNGGGDLTAALFCGYTLKGFTAQKALQATADTVYEVFKATKKENSRELALIQCRDLFK